MQHCKYTLREIKLLQYFEHPNVCQCMLPHFFLGAVLLGFRLLCDGNATAQLFGDVKCGVEADWFTAFSRLIFSACRFSLCACRIVHYDVYPQIITLRDIFLPHDSPKQISGKQWEELYVSFRSWVQRHCEVERLRVCIGCGLTSPRHQFHMDTTPRTRARPRKHTHLRTGKAQNALRCYGPKCSYCVCRHGLDSQPCHPCGHRPLGRP